MQTRIVSLLPGATEIVAALGLAGSLVARSHECDYPPEIRWLPACTAREIEVSESTPGIQLRATAAEYRALSAFNVDWDLLRGLHPTHILTQTNCASCGVNGRALEDILRKELFDAPALFNLESRSLPGVIAEIRGVGRFLGEPARGDALASSFAERLQQIGDRTKQAGGNPPVVACLESLQPLILAGDWIPELIRLSGGTPAHVEGGSQSSWLDWAALIALDPDVIVSMPCCYRLPPSIRETLNAAQRPEWKRLKAVRQNQVYVVDSSGYFSRPGPRLLDSLETLAEILSPEQFPPRNRDKIWVRFETETLL